MAVVNRIDPDAHPRALPVALAILGFLVLAIVAWVISTNLRYG